MGVETTQFDLSPDKMGELINSGRASAMIFFRDQEARLMQLQNFAKGREVDSRFASAAETKAYIVFKHNTNGNALLGVEIYGQKISFHTANASCLTVDCLCFPFTILPEANIESFQYFRKYDFDSFFNLSVIKMKIFN